MSTTIATAVTASSLGVGASLPAAFEIVAILLLIALLIAKELASASPTPRAQRFSSALNIGVLPLAIICAAIIVSKTVLALA